jgi:hypothetical protein
MISIVTFSPAMDLPATLSSASTKSCGLELLCFWLCFDRLQPMGEVCDGLRTYCSLGLV